MAQLAGIGIAICAAIFVVFQAPQLLILGVVVFVVVRRRRAKRRFDPFVEAMLK